MLSLILALTVAAQPAAPTQTTDPARPTAQVVRTAQSGALKCKWVVTKSGMARQFCLTGREWRDHQIERQQRLNEFTRRQLQINLTH